VHGLTTGGQRSIERCHGTPAARSDGSEMRGTSTACAFQPGDRHAASTRDTKGGASFIQNITSFALYGFPESHAASNQPMGFYTPAVLVKALWQVQRARRPEGPLLSVNSELLRDASPYAPLKRMTTTKRMVADYAGTGLTIGRHPMSYRREELRRSGVLSAKELWNVRDGMFVRTAGCVIARQRPGTAMGFIFLSMEMKPVLPMSLLRQTYMNNTVQL
jgi:DNA polymerase III alpha subunit